MAIYALARPVPPGVDYYVSQWWDVNPESYAKFGLVGHNGLDYAYACGKPILAAHDGMVSIKPFDRNGYGNYLVVDRGDMGTLYAHMIEFTVTNGQWVTTGTPIGKVGSTGNSTGCHLHFGWWIDGVADHGMRNYSNPAIGRKLKGD
jgi:murein DD-endopeptidase MepM/ murein hydrolase activator NlpD